MKSQIKMPAFDENANEIFNSLVLRSKNLFQTPFNKKIFFLHIPKCGGTSINEAIKSCYLTLDFANDRRLAHVRSVPSSIAAKKSVGLDHPSDAAEDYQVLKFRENLLLYYMCHGNINYIAGHLSFSETAYQYFHDKYAFITVLRDPVKRWISAYFYYRYKNFGLRKIDMDITACLKSEFGQAQGHQYVKFLGGADEMEDYTSEQAINRAKQNLHKFSIVGFLEQQGEFVKKFEEQFGRKLNIEFSNQSPRPQSYQSSIITEEIKEQIKAVCRPDMEIYQYAMANFLNSKN